MNADTAFNFGIDALASGDEEAAIPVVAAALRSHPRDARLHQILGLMHRALEQPGPAVDHFATAAALAPGDALIAHGHARAMLEAGRPASALFEKASRLAPNDGDVLLGLAAAQWAEGDPGAAISGLAAQLARHPGWRAGHGLIARLRWMSEGPRNFTASIEEALASAPRDTSLWRELIATLMQASRLDEALAAIARARAAAGRHREFDIDEAICVAEQGDFDRADRLFAALPPVDDISFTVRRIRHLLRSNRPAEAVAVAEPLTGGPGAEFVWPYLSVAWRLIGDPRWQWLEGDPRLVGVYELADQLPALDALAARLRGLHLQSRQPLEQSVRGGTQTDGPLFARIEPEIQALRAAIATAVAQHVAQLPPRDPAHPLLALRRDRPIRFAGSWSVRLAAQGRHANHIHPAGWFSSALYVALPAEAERGPPPAGWLQLGSPQDELGIALPPTRMIEPKPGRLVLFPSTMWHGTVPFAGGERMTVAFDVAPPR